MLSNLPIVDVRSNPHLDRFGGPEAVARLVAAFYRAMDTRGDAQTIRAMHAPDLTHTQAVLVKYLVEWMGGPKQYSAERGAPMLRRRHLPFDIDAAASEAWLACMRQALAETCDDADLRRELDASFTKIAKHVINTESPGSAPTPSTHRSPA
jgi:hemoglobin